MKPALVLIAEVVVPMVTEGAVATVVAVEAEAVAEVVGRVEGGSEGTESLVIICARRTALYTGDSWWPMIDSHVSPKRGQYEYLPKSIEWPLPY